MKAFGRRLAIMGTVASLAVGGAFAAIGAASAADAPPDCTNSICTVTIEAKLTGAYVADMCFWNETGGFGQCTGKKGLNLTDRFPLTVEYHESDRLNFSTHVAGGTDRSLDGTGNFFRQNKYCNSHGFAPTAFVDCKSAVW
jgi:hypothetical protein